MSDKEIELAKGSIKRLPELDIMKVIGIVLVVLGHVTRMYTKHGLIPQIDNSGDICIITQVIYSFHMPLFVFVSGMTFAYVSVKKSSYQGWGAFVRNKAKRLLIPYFAFALLWVLPFMVGFGFRKFWSYLIGGIILSLDCRHLWYVWMLFNVFLEYYVLRAIIMKFKMPQYSLLLIGGICFAFEQLWGGKIPYFQIDSSLCYFLWFSLGNMAIQYRHKFKIFTFVSLLVLFLVSLWYKAIFALLFCPLLGIFVIYMLSLKINFLINFKLFKNISCNSFGIYLFHPIIIYAIFYYLNNKGIDVYVLVLCSTVISFALSCCLTELMRIMNLQILIGEKR